MLWLKDMAPDRNERALAGHVLRISGSMQEIWRGTSRPCAPWFAVDADLASTNKTLPRMRSRVLGCIRSWSYECKIDGAVSRC